LGNQKGGFLINRATKGSGFGREVIIGLKEKCTGGTMAEGPGRLGNKLTEVQKGPEDNE